MLTFVGLAVRSLAVASQPRQLQTKSRVTNYRDELALGPTFRTEVVTEVVMPEENRIVTTRSGNNEHIGPDRICPPQRLKIQ